MPHYPSDSLIASLLQYGSLTRTIDAVALKQVPPTLPIPLVPESIAELPSAVIRDLWESGNGQGEIREVNRRSVSLLHLGVLCLSHRLDYCPTVGHSTGSIIKRYLIDNGIDIKWLGDAVVHASKQGMRRKLFSKPQYGRAWRSRRIIVNDNS